MTFLDPKALTSDGRTFTKWTRKDLMFLRKLHRTIPDSTLAQRLGKTVKAVRSRACRMGLKKGAKRLTQMGRENVAKRKRWPRKYKTK